MATKKVTEVKAEEVKVEAPKAAPAKKVCAAKACAPKKAEEVKELPERRMPVGFKVVCDKYLKSRGITQDDCDKYKIVLYVISIPDI